MKLKHNMVTVEIMPEQDKTIKINCCTLDTGNIESLKVKYNLNNKVQVTHSPTHTSAATTILSSPTIEWDAVSKFC